MKDNTALNVYLLCNLLIEELDQLEGTNVYKNKLKMHSKGLIKEIENFDQKVLELTEAKEMHEFINEKRLQLL